ncbi:MFS general substrate transporter [Aaosphaeria arxii CBS 175.79]|uniref:MFS general substrate transporter n=1 Tax=Aaosphaeria arxii CBS 175.79 TaxID=1450172 RepID=A0A6A5XYX3_9PLEO|nr:MFS general substrate transporter [Aaosphaeria arxii CBS 175.79]KAF2017830.1 MFS general substrate transporter [Aaosphaeria arxii CBS 175.79]
MERQYEMKTMPNDPEASQQSDIEVSNASLPSTRIELETSDTLRQTVSLVQSHDGKTRSKWRLIAIVTALFLALFVAALDATIIATAAPTISSDLNSAAGYTWIGASYLLATAASGPIWAKLSDIWGRKLIVLASLAVFFASSAVCATAKTMEALIVGRAFQGAAGGGIILLVHVCISDLFSLRQRSLLMGMTEGIWALAGGVGPIMGGVFASLVSWRWCFYINLPIAGVAALIIMLFLDIQHEHTGFIEGVKALDWLGMFTFLGFTLLVLLGLDFGGAIFPWDSAKVIALLVVGGVMIFGFIYSEAKVAKYPLIPMELFKRKTNVAALLVTFFHGFVFISAEYYMPLYLQSVLEATALKSGILLFPFIVTGATAGFIAGIVIHRTGRFREWMWAGTILMCIGFGLFIHFNANTTTGQAVGFQMIGGLGSGILFAPPLIAIQSQVAQDDVATATSTLSFVRNMAVTLSVVIGGTIFQNSMDGRASFLRDAGLPEDILDKLAGDKAMANVMIAKSVDNPAWELAIKQAFSYATRNMWITYTAFAFLGVVSSFFIDAAHLGTEHVETVTGLKKEKKTEPVQAAGV